MVETAEGRLAAARLVAYSGPHMYSIIHNKVNVASGGTGHLDWFTLQ
jgi:hypothetical protein